MNGMFWFQLVVIVALLAAVGWLAVGGGGHMSEPMQDRPDLALPREGLLGRRDVDRVRFSVGARGYRMDEVDDVLDRLAHEIDIRERRIAELEGHAPEDEEERSGVDFESAIPTVSPSTEPESEGDGPDVPSANAASAHAMSGNSSAAAASNPTTPGITRSDDSEPSA